MEELQVIETTSGRQFKPWASREDVQAIEQAVEQAVQDPASVTAIASEIASGKQAIAEAINAKGGTASATESFAELAEDLDTIPNAIDWVKMVCERNYPTTPTIGEDNPIRLIDNITSATVTYIGNSTFYDLKNLINVKFLNVTSIEERAFQLCSSLKTAIFPNVASIGDNVFNSCTSLETVDISNAGAIGFRAFSNCKNIQSIIADSVTTIGTCCFGPLVPSPDYGTGHKIKVLSLASFTSSIGDLFSGGNSRYYSLYNLILLKLGNNYDLSLNCATYSSGINWTAATYLTSAAEQWPNRLQLYTNLKEHLIDRLYDHSEDGVNTRVLRIGFYATLYADSQLVDEPYGSYYTPLIKAMAQACITTCGQKLWTISA